MNKGIMLVLILSVAVLLTGCSGQKTATGKTFIGGTEGLKISFLAGNPPDKTTDGGTGGFGIVVKLENVGESSIKATDGYVKILGIDSNSFGYTATKDFQKTFNQQNGFGTELKGAVKNFDGTVLNGGIATVDFGMLKYSPTIQGDQLAHIQADVCYKYKTQVATLVCVKSDVEQALTSKDICEVEGEKNPQNSGGPIQVTSLKESYVGGGKIGFSMTLTHSGTGDNFFKDDKLDCRDVPSNSDAGKVRIKFEDVQIAGKKVPVVCQGVDNEGYVRLYTDGSGKATYTLYCTVDVTGSNSVVEVPLNMELGYTYLQHINAEMTIRHIGQ